MQMSPTPQLRTPGPSVSASNQQANGLATILMRGSGATGITHAACTSFQGRDATPCGATSQRALMSVNRERNKLS